MTDTDETRGDAASAAAPTRGRGEERGSSEPERSDSLQTFGAVVKAFRRRAGLTQEGWSEESGYSLSTCAGIEQGRRFPPHHFIERAEERLDGFGALREAAKYLSRGSGLASWFRQWAQLEARALSLYTYECRVVPGLLQTEGYARAVIDSVPPALPEAVVEQRVAARMARQELLYRETPVTLSFIVEQALFERRTGGDEVTRELLTHLMTVAELRNVEFQIMPLVQPQHSCMDGSLQLLEMEDRRWFAYVEGQKLGQLITDEAAVTDLHHRYARLRSQALTPTDSLGLLKQMRGVL